MNTRPFISRFSPQRTEPDALEQILVQRGDLLKESVERVRESVLTGNKHHLLFIGPRGAGKTHLVTLIQHRLKQQADLADKMRIAWLNEDETATSFLKLLILIYRDLSQRYPEDFPAADLERIYGNKPDLARELLGNSLLQHLGSQTLVVIMENLDALFEDMSVEEQRTWRAFIQNHPVFATVGTAQSLFDGVSNRNEPFFGFFDTRHLDALNVDEAVTLLKNLATLNDDPKLVDFLNTTRGRARVQAIHDLAGGNPRLYIIFSDFLTAESLDDLVRPFEETADQQLTSYYQERLRWLSAQQREIVQFLCHQRHPVPVKQIAEGMFATHQTITNQLKILREYRYVRGNERGREVLYELAEPLMRLALQIKETNNREPLRLIVDFLRVWYDKKDLLEKMERETPGCTGRRYFEMAIQLMEADSENLRHTLFRHQLAGLKSEEIDDGKLVVLKALVEETGRLDDQVRLVGALLNRKNIEEAFLHVTRLIDSEANIPPYFLRTLYFTRAHLFYERDKLDQAYEDLKCASDLDCPDDPLLAEVLRYKAYTSVLMQKHERAIEDWRRFFLNPASRHLKKSDVLPTEEATCYFVVSSIFCGGRSTQWKSLTREFIEYFARLEWLPQLGDGLVELMGELGKSPFNHDTFDRWIAAWSEAAETLTLEDRSHLEIPLGLLRAGVIFLKAKNEGDLLILPLEQRRILRQALGLEPESE